MCSEKILFNHFKTLNSTSYICLPNVNNIHMKRIREIKVTSLNNFEKYIVCTKV